MIRRRRPERGLVEGLAVDDDVGAGRRPRVRAEARPAPGLVGGEGRDVGGEGRAVVGAIGGGRSEAAAHEARERRRGEGVEPGEGAVVEPAAAHLREARRWRIVVVETEGMTGTQQEHGAPWRCRPRSG